MNNILEIVQNYNLKISSEIYEQCYINNWINGWRYFLDLNIPICDSTFNWVIAKYKKGKKWIEMDEKIYQIIQEKRLLENQFILKFFKDLKSWR